MALVAFTRVAAQQLEQRLRTRLGPGRELARCATVHALAYSKLERQFMQTPLLDDEQAREVVKTLAAQSSTPVAEGLGPAELLNEVNRAREQGLATGPMATLAGQFEAWLEAQGQWDFTRVLALAAQQATPSLDYILVDEAQDLTALQLRFLDKVARKGCAFWFIGDENQSIYAFRGAGSAGLREMAARCGRRYELFRNYRSTQAVVECASRLIAFNGPGLSRVRSAAEACARKDLGHVDVQSFVDSEAEAAAAQAWLRARRGRAVLARTQALVAPLKQAGLEAYTVHEAKGREWAEVWVLGCESGLLPHLMAPVAEERRLLYVAVTRAEKVLRLSWAHQRGRSRASRKPSEFLFELGAGGHLSASGG
jgi:DNA helicase-2/ATP-dependent DNA helicase PcrA